MFNTPELTMLKKYWLLELSIFFISIISLVAIGIYWLWINQWFWIWLNLSILLMGITLLTSTGLNAWTTRQQKHCQRSSHIKSNTEQAINDLQIIIEDIKAHNPDLSDIVFYIDTLYRVVQTVAARFYPEQKNAYLEIKIPYFIKVAELIAHDFRQAFSNTVPGSHMVSLRQILSVQDYAGKGMRFYGFFRKLSLGTSLDSTVFSSLEHSSKLELRDWFIGLFVLKIGNYAIEIYSEQRQLDDKHRLPKTNSRQTALQIQPTASSIAEPLRILVLGQTGSGKSSFINALFGKAVAKADIIPSTKGLTAYLLTDSKLEKAIVYDSEGYGSDSEQLIKDASEEILRCDMIVLLVSAVNPARHMDCQLIGQIRAYYAAIPSKLMPPLVVAMTHIDQLRPWREWQPPYDIRKPQNAKASSIRSAMQIVAKELGIGLDQIAAICLKPGQEYNLEEGLIPTVLQHLDCAKQLRYLRCIDRYHQEDYWRRLWKQSKNAGLFIASQAYKAI